MFTPEEWADHENDIHRRFLISAPTITEMPSGTYCFSVMGELITHKQAFEIIAKLADFYNRLDESQAVRLNSPCLDTRETRVPDTRKPPAPGHVYIVRAADLCKIGMTTSDPHKRISALQTASPVKHETVLIISSDDPAKLEAELHERYTSKRHHGEWFALTADDVRRLKHEFENATD